MAYGSDMSFPFYPAADGTPLEGVVWLGVAGQNPVTNPVTVFWDAAGTQPVAQPVKISKGRTVRSDGTPGRVWVASDYSALVQDNLGRQVLFEPSQPVTIAAQNAISQAAAQVALAATQAGLATTQAGQAQSSAALAVERASAAIASQNAGVIGFDTFATLNASLAYAAGTIAYVTNDPTPTNNITYRKVGASGSGSWAAANTAPGSIVTAMDAALQTWVPSTFTIVYETGFYYDKTTGVKTTASGYKCTKFAITGAERGIRVSATVLGGASAVATYFNAGGAVIGFEGAANPDNTTPTVFTNYVLTVPALARFIAFSTPVANADAVWGLLTYKTAAEIASLQTSVAALSGVPATVAAIEDSVAIWGTPAFTPVYETNFSYNKDTGVKATTTGYKATKFAVTGSELGIRVTAHVQGLSAALAAYYDAGGVFISSEQPGTSNTTPTIYTNFQLTVPAAARFIAFSTPLSEPDAVYQVKSLVDMSGRLSPYPSKWSGKKIVWFGTSIPAGTTSDNYPTKVGTMLGATVVNEAVGASMARSGVSANVVPVTDPYGWSGQDWQAVAWCLAGSLAEKNYLISNWATVRLMLTGSPPATLNSTDQAKILDCSWENKLTRNLGAGRADLYVFDHGHNDNIGTDIATQPASSRDRGYFLGAMAFLIDKILADNPKARICFIGHYENARKTNISLAHIALAEYWDFPLLRLWEKLGWSQQVNTATGLTLTQTWMPDDLHPHSDTTGAANNLIADNLLPFLRDVR